MARPYGKCIVCGEGPTVKAHIFPRTLLLDIRGEEKHLVEGQRGTDGYAKPQNGAWDEELLCKKHEDVIGAGDKYAIEFIRRRTSQALPVENGRALALPNPQPDQLMHFVYASVWRHVVSRHGRRHNLSLGRYEPILQHALLNGGPYRLQALVGLSGLGIRETGPVDLVIDPYRQRLGDWNVWHFVICGFEFWLVTDNRKLPRSWEPYILNGNDPVVVTQMSFYDLRETAMLRPILRGMLKGRRQRNR